MSLMKPLEQSDSPNRSSIGQATAVLLVVLAIPTIYVLSTGPMVLLVSRQVISPSVVETIYFPLIKLYDRFELVQNAFDWYFKIWGV